MLILSQDAFYKYHTPEEIEQAFNNDLDFGGSCYLSKATVLTCFKDHPDSIDMTLFSECLHDLKQGHSTEVSELGRLS